MNFTRNKSVDFATAVAPQVLSASDTSDAIDLAGFEAATVVAVTGAIAGSGDFTLKLQESDTDQAGDFADVADADLVGSFPASLTANSVVSVGYRGHKRYVRTVITKNSGTSVAASVVVMRDHARNKPV